MQNICAYIAGALMVVLACIPPINFLITAPGEYFPMFMALAGFAGFFLLFLNTHFIVKALAAYGFFNCFFSAAPLVSFLAYIQLVGCCYFYVICQNIKDYEPVWKLLKTLLILNVFMFAMQAAKQDVLLNFSQHICFGVVGQHMQSASFSVILAAALLPSWSNSWMFPMLTSLICNSAGAFISAVVGMVCLMVQRWNMKIVVQWLILGVLVFSLWMVIGGKFEENISMRGGRLAVWLSTLKLTGQKWLFGWGLGTYKVIFPAIGGIITIPWKTTHNCWLQIFFETGIVGLALICGYIGYLVSNFVKMTHRQVFRDNAIICLSGLAMIGVNMMFHFPTRMIQCVLLIIFFISYCQRTVDDGSKQVRNSEP